MKPNADQPKAPESKPESKPKVESKPGSKPDAEGRSEIPAHAGSGEKTGVVAGRPQLKPRRRSG